MELCVSVFVLLESPAKAHLTEDHEEGATGIVDDDCEKLMEERERERGSEGGVL